MVTPVLEGCAAMQRTLFGGPTAQTVTDEIAVLQTATRGARLVADTLQNLHQLSEKRTASIAQALAKSEAACGAARVRLQAGDVSGAAAIIHVAQAEFANDPDIDHVLARAERLTRDPNIRAALKVFGLEGHLD